MTLAYPTPAKLCKSLSKNRKYARLSGATGLLPRAARHLSLFSRQGRDRLLGCSVRVGLLGDKHNAPSYPHDEICDAGFTVAEPGASGLGTATAIPGRIGARSALSSPSGSPEACGAGGGGGGGVSTWGDVSDKPRGLDPEVLQDAGPVEWEPAADESSSSDCFYDPDPLKRTRYRAWKNLTRQCGFDPSSPYYSCARDSEASNPAASKPIISLEAFTRICSKTERIILGEDCTSSSSAEHSVCSLPDEDDDEDAPSGPAWQTATIDQSSEVGKCFAPQQRDRLARGWLGASTLVRSSTLSSKRPRPAAATASRDVFVVCTACLRVFRLNEAHRCEAPAVVTPPQRLLPPSPRRSYNDESSVGSKRKEIMWTASEYQRLAEALPQRPRPQEGFRKPGRKKLLIG